MYSKTFPVFLAISFIACNANSTANNDTTINTKTSAATGNTNPYAFIAAIPLPEGYQRTAADSNSFGSWLRNVQLKKDKTVYLFNGAAKDNQSAQFAVLDISRGDKDLQQCAEKMLEDWPGYTGAVLAGKKQFKDHKGLVFAGNIVKYTI